MTRRTRALLANLATQTMAATRLVVTPDRGCPRQRGASHKQQIPVQTFQSSACTCRRKSVP